MPWWWENHGKHRDFHDISPNFMEISLGFYESKLNYDKMEGSRGHVVV
jgi:hypothetical protein